MSGALHKAPLSPPTRSGPARSSDPFSVYADNGPASPSHHNNQPAPNRASATDDAALLVPHPTLSATSAAALCAAVPGKCGFVVMIIVMLNIRSTRVVSLL